MEVIQKVAPKMEEKKGVRLQQCAAKISLNAQKIAEATIICQKSPDNQLLHQQLSVLLDEAQDAYNFVKKVFYSQYSVFTISSHIIIVLYPLLSYKHP